MTASTLLQRCPRHRLCRLPPCPFAAGSPRGALRSPEDPEEEECLHLQARRRCLQQLDMPRIPRRPMNSGSAIRRRRGACSRRQRYPWRCHRSAQATCCGRVHEDLRAEAPVHRGPAFRTTPGQVRSPRRRPRRCRRSVGRRVPPPHRRQAELCTIRRTIQPLASLRLAPQACVGLSAQARQAGHRRQLRGRCRRRHARPALGDFPRQRPPSTAAARGKQRDRPKVRPALRHLSRMASW